MIRIFSILFAAIFLLLVSFSFATNETNNSPIIIDANQFEYKDLNNDKIIIARGKVEAQQDKQKLFADYMEYNYNKDILNAKENIILYEHQGYVINAKEASLHNKLTLGSINNFSVLTPNGVTIRGEKAVKNKPDILSVNKGYFTSCPICPGKKTAWEIEAKEATLNEKENYVIYKHAILKLYGVPALYSPYFFNYTSKAERKSGFLTPEFGGSSYMGTAVKVPYYLNIAPNQDATVKLFTTSKRGNLFEGEHRYLTQLGQIDSFFSASSASYYKPPSNSSKPKHNIRYNFTSKTNLALENSNFLSWNVNTVSDKTFRKDFDYGGEDYLTSSLKYNSFQDSGYFSVESLAFQNLRPENSYTTNPINQTPIVLPLFESKHQIYEFADNSNFTLESSILNVKRYNGPETNRLSLKSSWNKYYLSESGHEFKFFTSLRNDFYHYEQAPINYSIQDKNTSRIIPEAGIDWQFPLTRSFKDTRIVVSPIVSATATPLSKYNKNIFSEDSSYLSELNDSNLFARSQYSGLDLVENTPRVSYGINSTAYYRDYLNFNALFGQLYRHKPQENIFGAKKDHFSDYVGRLQMDFNDSVILTYRYKLDKDSMNNKSNEIESLLKYKKLYLLTNLLYYKDDLVVYDMKNRRELFLEAGFKDFKKFSASINGRKNFSSKKDNPSSNVDPNGFISVGGKIKYDDECIVYTFSIDKDYTKNMDKKSNTSFWLKISLKNLG